MAHPPGQSWRIASLPSQPTAAVDDLEAAVRLAETAGARREGEISEHAWGRMALLADPFGHGVCLLQFTGRGYDEVTTP
jgi:uncharacterized glyoxalase superfamily protein PhnB